MSNFRDFLTLPHAKKYFNMLTVWSPEKLFELVSDAVLGVTSNCHQRPYLTSALGSDASRICQWPLDPSLVTFRVRHFLPALG